MWLELQGDVAALSAGGDQRIIAESGHRIAFDAPADVIRAVQDVATKVQKMAQESEIRN